MMNRLFLLTLPFFLFFVSNSSLAQIPGMTSWQSASANGTEIQLRMHDRTINEGYSLVEVSFSMAAARCALSDEVRIYIYQNDGSGSYGTQRYATSFDPGPGAVPISTSDMTRILVVSSGSTEPIYARAVISGVSASDDFVLTTPDCITSIVTSDAYDPNEGDIYAAPITSGTTHSGLLINNDTDYYLVSITSENRNLVVSMSYLNDYRTTESNLDLDLNLVNGTGILSSSTSSATSTSSPITETIDEILDPGTYYIVVSPKSINPNRNFYELRWDTYATPTYQISGVISDEQNNDISGVTMNGLPGAPVTNEDGFFGLSVEHGWSGTVTPTLSGYTFIPASRTYTDVEETHVNDGYTAILTNPVISGRITNGIGAGEAGVTLPGFSEVVVTDADGYYSGTVHYNWSGDMVPVASGLAFTPERRVYSTVQVNQLDQDFTSEVGTVRVTVNVTLEGSTDGLAGVTINSSPGPAVTDSEGLCSFDVLHGSSFTLTPVLEGYTFDPINYGFVNIPSSHLVNFTATLNTYEISGYLRDGSDMAVPLVTLSGLPGNPVTDGTGYYSVMVDHGWSGTVTPTLTGYTFDPVSMAYSNVTSVQSQNYTATPNTYTIDGHVRTGGGTGIAGVLMLGLPGSPTTNAEGYYSVSVLYDSYVYSSPILLGYSFSPSTVDYNPVIGDATTDYIGTPGPYLNSSQKTIFFTSEVGANELVIITSNVDWTVSCAESWITCSPVSGSNDGSFTVTANSANTSLADRYATVTVAGEGQARDIYVTQWGSDPFLEVSASSVSLGSAAASSQSVDITSNIAWTVSETADWLSVAPASGSGNGSLVFTADLENVTFDDRSTTVVVSGGGITRNIELTQAGTDPFLEVSASSVSLGSAAASNQSVDITSNIAWTISETADWLSVAPPSGWGIGSLTFTTDQANEAPDDRSTTVVVSGGGITRNIDVTQSGTGNILEVSSTNVTFGSGVGAGQTVAITSNIAWTASETSDWLTVSPASGSNDGVITLSSPTANEQIDPRTATVTVAGGGISHAITVTQAGGEASLGVSAPSENIATAVGSTLNLDITSNIAWTASLNEEWLSVSPASGTGNQVITLYADSANTESSERIATLNVEGGGMMRSITITQSGKVNTSIDELFGKIKFELYPNPATERVFLKSDTELLSKVRLKLMSISGQILYEEQLPYLIPGQPVEINLSAYPVGQYLIQIDNDYIQRVFKVIKL